MEPQKIQYLGPKTEVDIGSLILTTVSGMTAWSTREPTADTCEIILPDFLCGLVGQIEKDASLIVRHGYKGFDLETIFTGTVVDILPKKKLTVFGADAMRRLFETKLTITYQDETPTSIIRKMVGDLDIDASKVPEIEATLDRLPLYQNTVWQAVKMINDRLALGYDWFIDEEGVFHFEPRDMEQEPAFSFVYGKNILDMDLKASGTSTLLTVGMPVRHSTLVEVTDRNDETNRYFVTGVKRFLSNRGDSRILLHMERIDES